MLVHQYLYLVSILDRRRPLGVAWVRVAGVRYHLDVFHPVFLVIRWSIVLLEAELLCVVTIRSQRVIDHVYIEVAIWLN